MYKHSGRRLFLVAILTLIAGFVSLPRTIPLKFNAFGIQVDKTLTRRDINFRIGNSQFYKNLDLKLGLDLVGGSHLVFNADTAGVEAVRREEALNGLKEVIERRVNLYGVSEPNIQISSFEGNDRVIVELPGIRDTDEAIGLVGTTAQLMFAELEEPPVPAEGEEATESALLEPMLKPTELTGADLKRAQVSFDQVSGEPVVLVEFTEEGSKKFEALTERNVGKQVPILLDGQPVSAPVVEEKIIGGSAQISGAFTLDGAKELAIQLNAGALPISVELVSQETVGATLGRESVQKSIQAGLVGLGLVLVFMVIFYGKLGLVADMGLVVFGILTMALYKLIPVVLTLPGIAGFLLSVGMAVDANILIFERFREERKKGVNMLYALETSFGRAWDSIRDANIATLVTAFVLANPLDWPFLHTSGPVRGFAITLALGIGIGLFTGVFVSRNLLRFFLTKYQTVFIRERKEK